MVSLSQRNKHNASTAAADEVPAIWRLVARDDRPIVALKQGGRHGVPIYCIHSIGGDLSGYDQLAQSLDLDNPMFGLQVPRSLMMADTTTSIEDVAQRYADLLASFQPEGPFVIAGYSAGAVIGLELAQQLRQRGRDVPLLVAFDGAPNNSGAGLAPRQLSYLWQLIGNAPRRLASVRLTDFQLERLRMRLAFKGLKSSHEKLSGCRGAEWTAVLGIMQRPGWSEHQRKFMRLMFQAMVRYVPRCYRGAVILYEVRAQPFFHLMQYGAVWRKLAAACEIVQVEGRHSEFFQSPAALSRISTHLQEAIQKLESGLGLPIADFDKTTLGGRDRSCSASPTQQDASADRAAIA